MTALMQRTGTTREELHAGVMAVYDAAKAMLADGIQPRITLDHFEDDITVKQRAFLHAAVFPQIAEQVNANGVRFTAELWKEYYRKRFLPDRWKRQQLPGQKKPVPVRVRVSTEDLGIKSYSEHIDKVIASAVTDWSVVFVFRGDEREAVRYCPPARKAAKAQREEATA